MLSQKEIAVRLFENPRYGTTFGKGLYRSAVFNASAEIKSPHVKYLLDFESAERWQHTAKSDGDMVFVDHLAEVNKPDLLVSWVQRYDSASKTKTRVNGFATLDTDTGELMLLIDDVDSGIEDTWQLTAKPCRSSSGKNSPQLLATNAELTANW